MQILCFLILNIFIHNFQDSSFVTLKTIESFQYNKSIHRDYLTVLNSENITTTVKLISSNGISYRLNFYNKNIKAFLGMETTFTGKKLYSVGVKIKLK